MDWGAFIRPELQGMTAYSPGLRPEQVAERSGCEEILKLSSNEYPLGPTPRAVEAMTAALSELNRYPDGSCGALRTRLSEHWGVDEKLISVSNGSNELLRLLGQAVLRPGDEVVYAWPSFIVYPAVAKMFGAKEVVVPLDADLRHDLPAMLAAITPATRMVFLCNPNNPTGTIYEREEFRAFMAEVPPHVLVVVDEAYFEFADDPFYPDGLDFFDGVAPMAVLRTFSKIYSLAGQRVGYGFMPEPLRAAVDKIREPFNVNSVGQAGALASLDDQVEVLRRKHENREQKTYLYSCFDRLGIGYVPSQANFVWIKTQKPVEVFEALLSEGIIARDFGNAPALRLTMGTPHDTRLIEAALERIALRLGGI
jgi:histidinol-phosphate aminotransferase